MIRQWARILGMVLCLAWTGSRLGFPMCDIEIARGWRKCPLVIIAMLRLHHGVVATRVRPLARLVSGGPHSRSMQVADAAMDVLLKGRCGKSGLAWRWATALVRGLAQVAAEVPGSRPRAE